MEKGKQGHKHAQQPEGLAGRQVTARQQGEPEGLWGSKKNQARRASRITRAVAPMPVAHLRNKVLGVALSRRSRIAIERHRCDQNHTLDCPPLSHRRSATSTSLCTPYSPHDTDRHSDAHSRDCAYTVSPPNVRCHVVYTERRSAVVGICLPPL